MSTIDLSRRKFLTRTRSGLTLFAASSFLPNLSLFARAADDVPTSGGMIDPTPGGPDHFFVCVEITGAADVTLGLDPWALPTGADANDMFLEYTPDKILQAGNLRFAPAAFALAPYANDIAVINGISMRGDMIHESCRVYMNSGKSGNTAASVAIELAATAGIGPCGVLFNDRPYLMVNGQRSVTEGSTEDLVNGITDNDFSQLPILPVSQPDEDMTPLEQALFNVVSGKTIGAKLAPVLQAMTTKYGPLQPRHVMAAAFSCGASRQGRIDTNTDLTVPTLDTHSNHEGNHLKLQAKVWGDVADMFKVFKETPYKNGKLFDCTTFLIISEFSRTPQLVGTGKDHNPWTNSAVIAGKGVSGNKTVGGSRLFKRGEMPNNLPKHTALPFNFTEQAIATEANGASFIFPENVIRTVEKIFGDPSGFSSVADSANYLSSIVKV